ncbi:MAG: 1-acyl-sn-glycerol-3-phosphate acyltransferase [Alphaproteobacteria bacterium]|nr:MAG: 1-acyl-sn-glycerol-3-phosphate acyltransferase [Alphaproteobacteria bacterium]
MAQILAALRLIVIVIITLILMPVQAVLVLLFPSQYSLIPIYFHSMLCRIIGFEIEVLGPVSHKRPTLFISNHSSYLDIIVLSSILPVSFVAKAEIAGWPLFGWLAKLQKTVFINRRRSDAKQHVDQVSRALHAGQNLVIFPEGTSSDHNRILPFKPTLLRVADYKVDGKHIDVQPVCISLLGVNGLPAGRFERPYYAWFGDVDLIPHLWTLLGLGRMQIRVEFFEPIRADQFENHKSMAQYCQNLISSAHSKALTGREPLSLPPQIALQPA